MVHPALEKKNKEVTMEQIHLLLAKECCLMLIQKREQLLARIRGLSLIDCGPVGLLGPVAAIAPHPPPLCSFDDQGAIPRPKLLAATATDHTCTIHHDTSLSAAPPSWGEDLHGSPSP